MNFELYNQVSAEAEKNAEKFRVAYLVLHWPFTGAMQEIQLESYTRMVDKLENDGHRIVASVDHTGIITESKWVRDMVAGVAA